MNQFCPTTPELCTDPATVLGNYSSETPDKEVFISRSYGVQQDPPLGQTWFASSCVGRQTSTISQADANAKAQQANIACLSGLWPEVEDNPDPGGPPIFVPRETFTNELQTCSFECPDGNLFTFEVPAGTVSAFSQVAANDQAHSMACNGAAANRICIGELSNDASCVGDDFTASASISSLQIGEPGITVVATISGGSLPPGLEISNDSTSFTISGEASNAGEYNFTVKVSTLLDGVPGSSIQKSFTIRVGEIAPSTLPNGEKNNTYNQALTVVGADGAAQFHIILGALPTGLTLNTSSGLISGTPTAEGVSNFTIRADTEGGQACTKAYTLTVVDPVFNQLVWANTILTLNNSGTANWTGVGNDYTLNATSPDVLGSQAVIEIRGTMNYNGTGVARASTLFLNVLAATGFPSGGGFQNMTGVCRVEIDAGLVATIPGPTNENVGNYSAGFFLPAALGVHPVVVIVRIDTTRVNGFVTSLSYSGSIQVN
jgi:Putative Ig domain